jgi:hypothetical protein
MSRPCSCDGSNENCAHCYGRGFIEDGYAPASPSARAKIIKRTQKPAASTPVPYYKLPRLPKSTIPMRNRATILVRMDSCPLCGARVREDRLPKHMSNRCPLGPGKSTAPVRGAGAKCPLCKFEGGTDEFTRHFALSHGTKGRLRRRIQVPIVCVAVSSHPVRVGQVRKPGGKKNHNTAAAIAQHSANKPQESLRHKGKIEAEIPSWRNNLDATKNYGYPARESGRYGSHPSHDGFDDESKP